MTCLLLLLLTSPIRRLVPPTELYVGNNLQGSGGTHGQGDHKVEDIREYRRHGHHTTTGNSSTAPAKDEEDKEPSDLSPEHALEALSNVSPLRHEQQRVSEHVSEEECATSCKAAIQRPQGYAREKVYRPPRPAEPTTGPNDEAPTMTRKETAADEEREGITAQDTGSSARNGEEPDESHDADPKEREGERKEQQNTETKRKEKDLDN